MSASASAKDAIFVLQADQIDIAEIQKVGGVPVGIEIILRQGEPDSGGVGITLIGIVNGECQELNRAKFRMNRVTQVCCERRNSTTSGKIIPHDCDSIGQYCAPR